jgi:hypothetical protein
VTPARHPSRATSARWQDVLANAEQQLICKRALIDYPHQ